MLNPLTNINIYLINIYNIIIIEIDKRIKLESERVEIDKRESSGGYIKDDEEERIREEDIEIREEVEVDVIRIIN